MTEVLLTLLKKFWPYIVIAGLVATNLLAVKMWAHARTDLANYRAEVAAVGKAAEDQHAAEIAQHEDNLKKVKATYETQLADASVNAVANYLAHRVSRPRPSGSQVPASGSGLKMDDGSASKQLPADCEPDQPFILRAAHDAAQVNAWRDYCDRNNCTVEE